jgi:hypothetical protein
VFLHADFSLGRTLGKILTTVPGAERIKVIDQPAERVALLVTLLRTFRVLDRVNPESQVPMPASPRPGEAELDALDLLNANSGDFMRPIALFNRIDLTPQNRRYCGEHRIVYAKGAPTPQGTDRMFLIFEAAVDNPANQNPAATAEDRVRGCQRIADFWSSMQTTGDPAVIAPRLAAFYYDGELGDGGAGFDPVVHHTHFGFPFGQIRGNLFVNGGAGNPWMLREWRTSINTDGNAVFVADTVKSNPHPDLYAETVVGSPDLADLLADFQESFRINYVRELIELELRGRQAASPPTADELFSQLSARFDDRFNTFESNSQSDDHDPWTRAKGTHLALDVERELRNFAFAPRMALTPEHIFNRAGALSCAGCHQLSVDKPIAPSILWPKVAGNFVHIRENGELSEALTDHFLPARCDNLQTIISPVEVAEVEETVPPKTMDQLSLALKHFSTAEGDFAKTQALQVIEKSVDEARSQDARSPGAFIPFRRTH